MIKNQELFEQLVSEATRQSFSGWDFSWIAHRWRASPTSWDYGQKLQKKMKQAHSMLDMDTGGGEFLSSLSPLPPDTCATEGYAPNIPVAKERLEPLGIQVFTVESDMVLPFEDERFDLIANRHSSFSAGELYRILKAGGTFITQQVGGQDNFRLNELLQARPEFEFSYWTLDYAVRQLESAGFQIVEQREEFPETVVSDIGAVVYYLKAIPWQIAGFSVERYAAQLASLHNLIQDESQLVLKNHRFYIEATKREA